MTKKELTVAVQQAKAETRNALQTVYDSMNHGQQKQIVKKKAVYYGFFLINLFGAFHPVCAQKQA